MWRNTQTYFAFVNTVMKLNLLDVCICGYSFCTGNEMSIDV